MGGSAKRSVAIIGAGWAGLSAAVRLDEAGFACTVFEASRAFGGRARHVEWAPADGHTLALDNGQHILIGAYRETLALLADLGINEALAFERTTMRLIGSGGFELRAPRWSAPWHLLAAIVTARGLAWSDRIALFGFVRQARRIAWTLASDCSVAALLDAWRQPPALARALWAPLCIAALNTPVAIASAQVFLNVLRDSLGAARDASDFLIPRVDLGALLPAAAISRLHDRADLRPGRRVQSIELDADGVTIASGTSNDGLQTEHFDAAVLAVPAPEAARLLTPITMRDARFASLVAACERFVFQPIVTAYLIYLTAPRWSATMMALANDPVRGLFGQWAFDRSHLMTEDGHGLVVVVISAEGPHRELDAPALIEALALQLAVQLGMRERPLDAHVITEKRATFACVPDLIRPGSETPHPHLALAGDYTAPPDRLLHYPATLEAAVASGRAAARVIAART